MVVLLPILYFADTALLRIRFSIHFIKNLTYKYFYSHTVFLMFGIKVISIGYELGRISTVPLLWNSVFMFMCVFVCMYVCD